MRRELEVLTKVPPSRFLQRCHKAFESDSSAFFIVDYIGGGDLLFHLARVTQEGKLGFGEDACRTLLAEVHLGVAHLHGAGILHADLKLENIMLTSLGHAKVVDYGLSRRAVSADPFTATGSLIYMAPELLYDQVGGFFTDWWAFGVLSHELLTGRSPWSSLTDKKLIRKEIRGLSIKNRLNMSQDAFDMVKQLLCKDFTARLGTRSSVEVRAPALYAALLFPFFFFYFFLWARLMSSPGPLDWAFQISKAPFWGGDFDWEALAAGNAPPAFLPGTHCVSKDDARQALVEYLERSQGATAHAVTTEPAPKWFLGLEYLSEHPKLHPRLQLQIAEAHMFGEGGAGEHLPSLPFPPHSWLIKQK